MMYQLNDCDFYMINCNKCNQQLSHKYKDKHIRNEYELCVKYCDHCDCKITVMEYVITYITVRIIV